jgi:hypothetical protein
VRARGSAMVLGSVERGRGGRFGGCRGIAHRGKMIKRFGSGRLLLLLLFVSVGAFAIFDHYKATLLSRLGVPLATYSLGAAFYLVFITYYRLLQEFFSSREAGRSVSEWQPLAAIEELYKGSAPAKAGRENVIAEFRISPWPWVKIVGLMLALISGPMLLLWVLKFERLPFTERFSIPLHLLGLVALAFALFGTLFIMNYRIIHVRIGAYGCSFRLGPMHGADVKSIISTRHGAFPLAHIAALWSRERLSSVLKWKQIDYGITFKAGDQLHLGSTAWHHSGGSRYRSIV